MTRRGVDLSHHNEEVSFNLLKGAGVEFVALKATEGDGFLDPTFHDRQARARAVGFSHLLFYHFVKPGDDPADQARAFAHALGELRPGELLVLDVEASPGWDAVPAGQSAALVRETVTRLKASLGFTDARILLYGSLGWLRGQFGSHLADLTTMPLWAARYADTLGDVSPWPRATIWQYSERGTVAGAGTGDVDLDVWLDPRAWA